MSNKAKEVFEYAKRQRKIIDVESWKSLKERAIEATTDMMKAGEYVTEIDLTDNDIYVLEELTTEIHRLGYKYCLIEVQDEDGDITEFRFRISVSHLDN